MWLYKVGSAGFEIVFLQLPIKDKDWDYCRRVNPLNEYGVSRRTDLAQLYGSRVGSSQSVLFLLLSGIVRRVNTGTAKEAETQNIKRLFSDFGFLYRRT